MYKTVVSKRDLSHFKTAAGEKVNPRNSHWTKSKHDKFNLSYNFIRGQSLCKVLKHQVSEPSKTNLNLKHCTHTVHNFIIQLFFSHSFFLDLTD